MNSGHLADVFQALIWPADSPIAQWLIRVIGWLFVLAVLCTLRHAARLWREHRALRNVEQRLGAWRQATVEATPEETASASGTNATPRYPRMSLEELRSKLIELRIAAGRGTHVATLVETIHKLRSHRVKINLATLQQLVERDESTRSGVGVPHYVANVVIMLGILGTFWGLGHMVRSIGIALPEGTGRVSVETWTHSIAQVRTVLEGMRTAFSTSLVGMAAAIITGAFGSWLVSRQQKLLKAIEAFAINDLLPATVPTLEDDSVLEQVSGQLETAFTRIDAIAAQNLQSIREFTAAQATFRALVEDVRAIAHGEANRDLERVLESVIGSNEALVELLRSLPPALEAKRDVDGIRTMLAGTNETLQKLVAALPRRFEPPESRKPRAGLEDLPPLPLPPEPVPSRRRGPPMLVTGLVVVGVGFVVALLTVLG